MLVDDIDLATVDLNTYRSQLGVVLQESFLFDGTIRENIMFSRPDATEEQFLFACRTASVDEFAERFPEGYDTIVGERGVKLSGGQRQRLVDCAGPAGRAAHPHSRRGHQFARLRIGSHDPERAR